MSWPVDDKVIRLLPGPGMGKRFASAFEATIAAQYVTGTTPPAPPPELPPSGDVA